MTKAPKTVSTVAALRQAIGQWRESGDKIALVPTMGALHEGHLSLVRLARQEADKVVVSIFVNPAQFAPGEDLATYPRDEAGDMAKLQALGTDLVYAPAGDEMYRSDFSTRIEVSGISEGLCGGSRPHFFGGVATVVAKLFLQCRPDIAIFGEKDYQQLLVIRRMARDLDIPVEVLGGALIREDDGLAMSSRNAYLSDTERKNAPLIFATITQIAKAVAGGAEIDEQLQSGKETLTQAGFDVDYLEVRNAENLTPLTGQAGEPARVFAAAMLGKTRLIDNVAVPEKS